MADPRFYDNHGPFALGDLAARLGGRLREGADGSLLVRDVASLENAAPDALCYASTAKHLVPYDGVPPGPAIMPEGVAANLPSGAAVILHENPPHAFAAACAVFYPTAGRGALTRPNMAVDPTAQLGDKVRVEHGATVGAHAHIGAGTIISANSVVGPGVQIGRDCYIGPNVTVIYALLGDRVQLHAGVRVGADGFGFTPGPRGLSKVLQLGRAILQDDVDVGANSCIDRGTLDDTVVGEGTKIDNLVQIAHNVRVGRHCVIVAQAGIAGSSTVGDGVMIGGQTAIRDHVTIGPGAQLAARSGVMNDLPGGAMYGGTPAGPFKNWMREILVLRRLAKEKKRSDD